MKVIVTLEIEVDRDEWNEVYGIGESAAEIRQDVKEYAAYSLNDLCHENNGARVTLRG